ncbi:MAG TPA: lyase family protein [Solirubrobacteraceae bacterium]|nr:lyase family protein [Solirubrobacteraceae bacterium]
MLARGRVAPAVADERWLRAMLDAEAALASARGLPAEVVDAIGAARLDARELGVRAAESGNPVVPLVEALRELAGPEVHRGATSQDILDTAAMLVVRDALVPLREDLAAAADAAARLAAEHRATPVIGRTLLQQAVPTTFGLKAAGWMGALDTAGRRLAAFRPAAQLGGPAGTLDGLGPEVLARYAALLGLDEPALPWHTDRTRIAELAGALGTACGAIAKAAGDVVLLAQTEVGEVREAAPGGSSSMPHKRNPIAAISARACARQAPGLVATLLATMEQEHERAAGAWHAEWAPLRALLVATGSAADWLRTCLDGLEVDAERMRANLGGLDEGAVANAAALVDRALAARRR